MFRKLFYSFILSFIAISASATEAIIDYGDLNTQANHDLARQELQRAIAAQALPILVSFGKDQQYPPGYYYWRYVVDITNRENEFLSLQAQYHQKNLYGFTVSVRKIDSYLIGHTLIGRSHSGGIILQSNNFDLKSFTALSEVLAYASQVAFIFQNAFWTDFYQYVAQIQPALAQELDQKKADLREMLLVNAITIHASEGNDISYRVSKYYNIIGGQ